MKIKIVTKPAVIEEVEITFPCFRKKGSMMLYYKDDNYCMSIHSNGDVICSNSGYYHNQYTETKPATKEEFMKYLMITEKAMNEVFKEVVGTKLVWETFKKQQTDGK